MLKISKSLHSLFSLFDALPLCRLVAGGLVGIPPPGPPHQRWHQQLLLELS